MTSRLSINVKHHPSPCKSCGFSMMEIIAVIVILGILSGIAISRLSDTGARDTAAANTLKAHLRYAQLRAMGDTVSWGIEIEAEKYTLKKDGDDAPVNLPGENEPSKEFEKASVNQGTGTVYFFPARGRPYLEGSDPESFTDEYPDGYTISLGTSSSSIFLITAETGFIE